MSEFDVIEAESESEGTAPNPLLPQPILIKGSGSVTVFGLSSRFDASFPRELTGKVAPEEFKATMARLNGVVRKSMPVNVRWLFCGCLLCCCTLGCSLWPVLCLSRRVPALLRVLSVFPPPHPLQTIKALDKALDWENQQLYNKLGLHWRLARRTCDSSNLAEYVRSSPFSLH